MRKILLLIFVTIPLIVCAQWKIGVGMGPSINNYPYQDRDLLISNFMGFGDFNYGFPRSWGISVGIYGQYNFNEYIGIRADLNWTQKNVRRDFSGADIDAFIKKTNNYLQLPVMATGGLRLGRFKLYLDVGVYGAYWLSSTLSSNLVVKDYNGINSDYDNRLDCGFVGGGGGGFCISHNLTIQIEVHCYYSVISNKKELNGIKNPRYNTTWIVQPTLCYSF